MWWYFIVSCCYGTLSVFCYLLILAIFFFHPKGEFSTTYYKIFAYSAVVNILCYLNSFMVVRLPQITSSDSFLAPIFGDFWGLEIFHCLMNHFAYLQYFFTLLLNGNRMSVVLFPLKHEKFWRKYLYVFLLVIFLGPLVITHEILFGNSYYTSTRQFTNQFTANSTAPDQFGLVSSCNMDKQGKALVLAMCISTIIGAVFNVITLWKLKQFTKSSGSSTRRTRTEIKLFVHGLINFLVDTFATIVTLGLMNPDKGTLFVVAVQLLPFASDAISFVSGWVLIACSQPLRNAFRRQMGWEVESTTVPDKISRHPPTRTAVTPLA